MSVDTGAFTVARERVTDALKSIADLGTHVDTGGGLGSSDYWVKIGGVEYYLEMRISGAQTAKDAAQ